MMDLMEEVAVAKAVGEKAEKIEHNVMVYMCVSAIAEEARLERSVGMDTLAVFLENLTMPCTDELEIFGRYGDDNCES